MKNQDGNGFRNAGWEREGVPLDVAVRVMVDAEKPDVSSHAELRFVQRTGIGEQSVARVWREGEPVKVEARDYHHARYNAENQAVLLAHGGVITTVLDATFEEFRRVER